MIIPLIVFFIAAFMVFYEMKHQGRTWPQVRGWWLRALLLNGAQVGAVYLAGLTWDRWMIKHQFWNLHSLGNISGAFLGYFVITFVFYWWHRFRHKSDFLWRWFHQMHHSPKRLEIITAFYKHPFELIADSILCSVILFIILGLNPVAASYAVLLSALAELFYHWNVSTPYWVGYIFQRPENHCIHHQDGVHAFNYADLPLWDMLFGTFKNVRSWEGKCGLGEGGEHRFLEMLQGIDISKAPIKEESKRNPFSLGPFIVLVSIGLVQMLGDVTNLRFLKGIGAASCASPAPKVFCVANSLETFSSQFFLEWNDDQGNMHKVLLTTELASLIKGPYQRRNVYGAILSYGPVLEANPHMKPLYESILNYSIQGKAPLLEELEINIHQIKEKVAIEVVPRQGSEVSHLNLVKEVSLQ